MNSLAPLLMFKNKVLTFRGSPMRIILYWEKRFRFKLVSGRSSLIHHIWNNYAFMHDCTVSMPKWQWVIYCHQVDSCRNNSLTLADVTWAPDIKSVSVCKCWHCVFAIPAYRIHINQSTVDVLNSLKLGYKIQVRGMTELKVNEMRNTSIIHTDDMKSTSCSTGLVETVSNECHCLFPGKRYWEHILVGGEGRFQQASAYSSRHSRVSRHFLNSSIYHIQMTCSSLYNYCCTTFYHQCVCMEALSCSALHKKTAFLITGEAITVSV